MPTVPSYSGADEYSLGQQQQSFLPRQPFMPGMRPIMPQSWQPAPSLFGGSTFGGNGFGSAGGMRTQSAATATFSRSGGPRSRWA